MRHNRFFQWIGKNFDLAVEDLHNRAWQEVLDRWGAIWGGIFGLFGGAAGVAIGEKNWISNFTNGFRKEKNTDQLNSTSQISKTTQISTIDDYGDLKNQATNLVENAKDRLWIAVDTPAFGSISEKSYSGEYDTALRNAYNRHNNDSFILNILWFSNDFEDKLINSEYFEKLYSVDPQEKTQLKSTINSLRTTFDRKNVKNEAEVLCLIWHDFWVARTGSEYDVLLSWTLPTRHGSTVRGIRSSSPELAKVLIEVFKSWKDPQFKTDIFKLNKLIADAVNNQQINNSTNSQPPNSQSS